MKSFAEYIMRTIPGSVYRVVGIVIAIILLTLYARYYVCVIRVEWEDKLEVLKKILQGLGLAIVTAMYVWLVSYF
ncbi:MAG: hypothetical protein IJI56_02545 [Firmicutes bacterium]|nr:hypothetical protein [Bacillota bacterium]